MKISKQIRIQRMQNKSRMVGKTFSTLDANERRRTPWLGREFIGEENQEKRRAYIEEWDKETARLLKANPNLKIVD